MSSRIEAVARARAWGAAARGRLLDLTTRVGSELRQTVDLGRWRQARNWRERLTAVSWPRAGAAAAPVALVLGGLIFFAVPREGAYPPPEPSAREIALRLATAKTVRGSPPPGLASVNQPIQPK